MSDINEDINNPPMEDINVDIAEELENIEENIEELEEINELEGTNKPADQGNEELDENESQNIGNLMEQLDENETNYEETLDYIQEPVLIANTDTKNKPLPKLTEFQDIVEIITSDNNILNNENALVSENTNEFIRILIFNEDTGKEIDITLKKEADGSLMKNNRNIIYLRKESDVEDGFDHEEFKISLTEANRTGKDDEQYNEDDIQTEDIVKVRIKKQEQWEQQYDIREQKTDMFNQLIQKIPSNQREAKRKEIDKTIDTLFDMLEDVRSEQLYKGSDITQTENPYYKEYMSNIYNLEWLIPIVLDTTISNKNPALSSRVKDQIREQLRRKVTSYTDANKLYNSKHHRDSDAAAEYKGDLI